MNISCPESSPCVDPAQPVTNFSTEAPDPPSFISLQWPIIIPDDPVGGDPGTNQPPNIWTADGCLGECTSNVSQADADQCAALQAQFCAGSGPDKQNKQFLNSRQECDTVCPDGSPFAYFVAAGLFAAGTQQAADAQAQAFACASVQKFVFCLSDITSELCVGTKYDSTISVIKGNGPFTMALVGGTMPGGFIAQQTSASTMRITGTPTAPGFFSFAVKATDKFGNFMTRTYGICVIDIEQSALPDATVGQAYNGQLTATFCAKQTQNWQIIGGSLPPGLSLDQATGKITGTPTVVGTSTFTVLFQDEAS